MKYSVLLVLFGTVLAAIHALSCLRIVESVTLPTGAPAGISLVPMNDPGPMVLPGTLYSWSWVMRGLTTIA